MTFWRGVLLGLVLAVAPMASCAAPILPIPPPGALVSAPDATGFVTVSGQADSRAFVFVLHENTETGLITHATAAGTYTVRIQAPTNDAITVWQEIGNRASMQVHLTVP